ncbi:hypothetical protein KR032_004630 [Drosophila birchii]|nr:hypothetical protein KR032_004630 [Drosophila birchii]
MKCALILACLTLYVAYTSGQDFCLGRPVIQVCQGGRDEGNANLWTCHARNQEMWFYNSRTRSCNKMRYRGCGGNNNRYCSDNHCRRVCRR